MQKRIEKIVNIIVEKFIIIILFFLIILVSVSLYRSKYTLSLSNFQIHSSKLDAPVRIVQLTDLHNSEFGENNGKLIELTAQQSPDLIVLTGDLLNSDEEDLAIASEFVKKLCKIAPVYLSLGNHELQYQENFSINLTEVFEAVGAVVLDKTYKDIEINGQKLRLGGVYGYCLPEQYLRPDHEEDQEECTYLNEFQNTDRYAILLTHMPACWLVNQGLDAWDVDCVFSGHVHGGQMIFPGIGGLYGPDMGWFPGKLEGLYYSDNGENIMVLSRGLGSTGKIPRFNNLPEVVVVDLLSEE